MVLLSVVPAVLGVDRARFAPPIGVAAPEGRKPDLSTVMLIVAVACCPLPRSVYERTTVALPIAIGLNASPLRAAFRLASVPWIVIDAEPLAPDVNVIPVVLPNISVPSVALNVSGSTVLPALTSAILTGRPDTGEKTRVEVTSTVAFAGAVIAGGLLLTVRATLF